MTPPIRLLYVRDTLTICGPGKTILNTYRTIDRSRFELTVAATRPAASGNNALLDALNALGAPTVPFAIGGGIDLGAVWRLVRLIRERKIDILQTHDAQTRRLGVLAAAITGVRHVTSVHGWIFNDRKQQTAKWIDARLIGLADRAIAVSGRLGEELTAAGVPASRLTVVRNAVLLGDYGSKGSGEAVRAEFNIPRDHRVISIIGRISAEKGHEVFLAAAKRILERHPKTTFMIVGDGPLRARVGEAAQELGIASHVVFTGHRAKTHDIYGATDVIVISSFTEGIPNVLLEAYAYEMPAVATDVGGVGEVMQDGVSGWLVQPGDPEIIADKVNGLLADDNLRERMGRAGRLAMEHRHNFERRTRVVEELYDSLMAGEPAFRPA